ncbi:catalase [cf. Phormidesmis sp. LEGE 11477]|uniref:catalase n=1 Tax=cf. Phormidesmis sp. LEGE 11477 TaxID=1828680 RepID=UPI00187E6E0D|nr:catalase [cf. Phormidesmis sp. LEGE 11477]MBE9059750.1 catalase [cf. Phormidesmis sp. LEGE 11477]
MANNNGTLTNAAGIPIASNEVSKTAGKYGPLLMEDYTLLEKMAHFNRERVPERVVHAVGAGAYGTFTVTDDITHLTKAKLFSEVGQETEVFARFSTVAKSKGGSDIYRDIRGFSVKFYTEDGNWDMVGNDTPIFFMRDPMKFMDFIRSQKEHPESNWRQDEMWWDFWSQVPESLHQVMWLMGDRGAPMGWRHLNGYGSHTFSFINAQEERIWVKFHFKTDQGIKNFTEEQWQKLQGIEPRWATKDLFNAIDEGNYPSWTMYIQTMTEEQAKNFQWNPFDLTKIWPHADYPLQKVGRFELNRNPENFFAEVEQAAFSPGNMVPGISWSPDRMLQARIMSYADAHRYRLGVNYDTIPVNKPHATEANTPYRDGSMRVDGNYGNRRNYHPTEYKYPTADQKAAPPAYGVEGMADRQELDEKDYADQAKMFYQILNDGEKDRLVHNISGSLGKCRDSIKQRQLGLFREVDEHFAERVKTAMSEVEPLKPEPKPASV